MAQHKSMAIHWQQHEIFDKNQRLDYTAKVFADLAMVIAHLSVKKYFVTNIKIIVLTTDLKLCHNRRN